MLTPNRLLVFFVMAMGQYNIVFGQSVVSDDKFCFGNTGSLFNSFNFGLKNKHFRVNSVDSFQFQNSTYSVSIANKLSTFIINQINTDSTITELSLQGRFSIFDDTRDKSITYLLAILDSGLYNIGGFQLNANGKRNAAVIPINNGRIQKPFEVFSVANTQGGYFGYLVTLLSDGNSLISTYAVRGKVTVNGQTVHDDELVTGFYAARYSFTGTLLGIEKLAESKDIIFNSKLNQSSDGFVVTFTFFDSLNVGIDTFLTIKPPSVSSNVADLMVVGLSSDLKKKWHRVFRSQGEDSDLGALSTSRKIIWINGFLWAGRLWFGNQEFTKERSLNSFSMIRTDDDNGNPLKVLEMNGLTSNTRVHQSIESDTSVILSLSFPGDTVRIDRKPYVLLGKGCKAVYFRLFNSGNSELIGGLRCDNSDDCFGILDWLPTDKKYSLVVNTNEKSFTFLHHTFTNDCMIPSKRYGRYLIFEDLSTNLAKRRDEQLGLTIHPNPATSHFSWQSEANIALEAAAIYDLRGGMIKQLNEWELSNKSAEISGLARGIYIVKFQTAAGMASAKLVLR